MAREGEHGGAEPGLSSTGCRRRPRSLSLGSESWVQAGSWWKRLLRLFDQTGQGGGSHAAWNTGLRAPGVSA